MKKVLIFPLLNSMPSGHHQVANAICKSIEDNSTEIVCKKMDILSEWNPVIEGGVVKAYLQWIRHFPETYAWTYRKLAYRSKTARTHIAYEILFMKKVKKILAREKPDLIICTHGFASLFINRLKQDGECTVPAINVYTDFFINDVWGCSHIDYHFAPSRQVKNDLAARFGVDSNRIFVTGIPVSPEFSEKKPAEAETPKPAHILVSGGSAGLGNIADMLSVGTEKMDCRISVLCGANKRLYEEINQMKASFATAYPYISSREQMNRLYDEADAIISKPGGVTVSEALHKELPIFISNALPGQEQINLQILIEMGLVFVIPPGENAVEYVYMTLRREDKMSEFKRAVASFRNSLEIKNSRQLFETIDSMLERS